MEIVMWLILIIGVVAAVGNWAEKQAKTDAAKRKAQEEARLLEVNPESWRALKEHERKEKEQKVLEEELKKQAAHERATNWTRLGAWWWRNW